MADSFWKTAADSLPPQVRWRYAKLFEAAEEFDRALAIVVTAGSQLRGALAQSFLGMAGALRKAAGMLDLAARRLTISR